MGAQLDSQQPQAALGALLLSVDANSHAPGPVVSEYIVSVAQASKGDNPEDVQSLIDLIASHCGVTLSPSNVSAWVHALQTPEASFPASTPAAANRTPATGGLTVHSNAPGPLQSKQLTSTPEQRKAPLQQQQQQQHLLVATVPLTSKPSGLNVAAAAFVPQTGHVTIRVIPPGQAVAGFGLSQVRAQKEPHQHPPGAEAGYAAAAAAAAAGGGDTQWGATGGEEAGHQGNEGYHEDDQHQATWWDQEQYDSTGWVQKEQYISGWGQEEQYLQYTQGWAPGGGQERDHGWDPGGDEVPRATAAYTSSRSPGVLHQECGQGWAAGGDGEVEEEQEAWEGGAEAEGWEEPHTAEQGEEQEGGAEQEGWEGGGGGYDNTWYGSPVAEGEQEGWAGGSADAWYGSPDDANEGVHPYSWGMGSLATEEQGNGHQTGGGGYDATADAQALSAAISEALTFTQQQHSGWEKQQQSSRMQQSQASVHGEDLSQPAMVELLATLFPSYGTSALEALVTANRGDLRACIAELTLLDMEEHQSSYSGVPPATGPGATGVAGGWLGPPGAAARFHHADHTVGQHGLGGISRGAASVQQDRQDRKVDLGDQKSFPALPGGDSMSATPMGKPGSTITSHPSTTRSSTNSGIRNRTGTTLHPVPAGSKATPSSWATVATASAAVPDPAISSKRRGGHNYLLRETVDKAAIYGRPTWYSAGAPADGTGAGRDSWAAAKRWAGPSTTELPRGVHWVQTGQAVTSVYKEARGEANGWARARNACFQQATQAFLAGNRKLAKELSARGREYADRMWEAHARAAHAIYDARNTAANGAAKPGDAAAAGSASKQGVAGSGQTGKDPSSRGPPSMPAMQPSSMLDLHGLHVSEALTVLEQRLVHEQHVISTSSASRSSGSGGSVSRHGRRVLHVLTGAGHHSTGPHSKARLPAAVEGALRQWGLRWQVLQPGLLEVQVPQAERGGEMFKQSEFPELRSG